jgi:hypothetical protein
MIIPLDNTYQGAFEHTGTSGSQNFFESAQGAGGGAFATAAINAHLLDLGVEAKPEPTPVFEINTVKWSVDNTGHLAGTARFLAMNSHDLVKATLSGTVSEPAVGQDARIAQVDVTFNGGTGKYANATGSGKVVAKLYSNGLSVGHITGSISVE